jgi:glycosyltransferase involved in cell wall biosynthesis
MTARTSPMVSVVIPSYNHDRYLGRALQSVLDQTYAHWEALVIDNHSTDGSDKVLNHFADPRIKVLKIHNNGVIAASRNMGIRAANGEWVAFLDSDDWWAPNKLQSCFNCVNDQVDFVYHDLDIVADKYRYLRQKTMKSWQVKKPVLMDLLLNGNAIYNSSVVIRRGLLERIGGINENIEMIASEDYHTWLRVAQLTNQFKHIPEALGFYQVHDKGISSRRDMSVSTKHAVSEFIDFLSPQQRCKFEANLCYTRGRFNYRTENYRAAKRDLLVALMHGNFSLKPKLVWMLSMIWIFHR